MLVERYMPAVGGVEKHLANLLEVLENHPFEFTILTASHLRGLKSLEKAPYADVIRIPYGQERNPLALLRFVRGLRNRIAPYDILHIHDVMPLLSW
jgi:hypothetical protein